MRLDTKEKRLEARKFYYDEGAKMIDMPEIQLQAFTADNPRGKENYYTLVVFIGTAGKPSMNYYYRTKERRDTELQKAIDAQKRRLAYKAQAKEENKGKLTGAAATAAAIRTRLKKEFKEKFPGVKFSVTSSNFSMGNSVDIEWTDGPMSETVDAIVKQYEYGRFDGMQDLSYNVKIDEEGLGCPGAKYVHASRRLSEEYRAQIKEVLEQNFAPYHAGRGGNYGNDNYAPFQWTEAEKILLGVSLEEDQGQEQEEETETQKEQQGQEEPREQQKPSNVIDITARIKERQKQKQEEAETHEAIKTFRTDYLPYITRDDMNSLLSVSGSADKQAETIAKICMRIDLERMKGQK